MRETLLRRRDELHKRWLESILAAYPSDAATFFEREGDRFSNPVGYTLATQTATLLEELIGGKDPATLDDPLRAVIKIRSIQELGPSAALGFILDLKLLAREIADGHTTQPELDTWDNAVDRLLLHAIDLYMECREQLFDIRVAEAKRNVSGLIRQLNRRRENSNDHAGEP